MRLGAGRVTKEDRIDPGVGLTVEVKVGAQVQEYAKNPEKAKQLPPPMPGVNTLAGRIILNRLEATLYGAARQNVEALIQANEDVREGLKKLRKK